jgi:ABC-type multidrug transport system ATPase subunit
LSRISTNDRAKSQLTAEGGTVTVFHELRNRDGQLRRDAAAATSGGVETRGVCVRVDDLSRRVRVRSAGEITLLDRVSLSIAAGELVAIVGPSGAGKSTLLGAMAGITPTSEGSVRFDGIDVRANFREFRGVIGYVPQDDIIHTDLALTRTLRYAARLRLPSATTRTEIDHAVAAAIESVGLSEQADVRVGSLSGGQRKRASIAVELLTSPRVFFLDEPTSGLDPVTSAEVVAQLRHLADRSATVVFTTHSVEDLDMCDRVVFMARGGRVAFVGTVDEALEHFAVSSVPELYRRLAGVDRMVQLAGGELLDPVVDARKQEMTKRPVADGFTQWHVLTRRTLETFLRNPLTLAILLASPALVVGMFAVLFRPGAFEFRDPSPSSMVMIGFWVVFAAFFFGLTYGLLQICTERTILERERLVGLRVGAYVASKVTVLIPFLLVVILAMLGVLRALNRLPDRPLSTYGSIAVGLLLCATAALGLGLLTSASVRTVPQATLALPMLCFPAVLFGGAILPVHLMARAGAAISAVMPSRWAFEAIGHDLGARHILADGGSRLGPPLLASFGDAGTASTVTYWLILVAFSAALLVATWFVLVRSTRGLER